MAVLEEWAERYWKADTRLAIVASDTAALGRTSSPARIRSVIGSFEEVVAQVQHAAIRGQEIREVRQLCSQSAFQSAIDVVETRDEFIEALRRRRAGGDWMWDGGHIAPSVLFVRLWSRAG